MGEKQVPKAGLILQPNFRKRKTTLGCCLSSPFRECSNSRLSAVFSSANAAPLPPREVDGSSSCSQGEEHFTETLMLLDVSKDSWPHQIDQHPRNFHFLIGAKGVRAQKVHGPIPTGSFYFDNTYKFSSFTNGAIWVWPFGTLKMSRFKYIIIHDTRGIGVFCAFPTQGQNATPWPFHRDDGRALFFSVWHCFRAVE